MGSEQLNGFPVVEACYAWTWNDFHMTPHQHNRAEIMYLLKGKGTVHLYKEDKMHEVQLHVGEFIFIEAGIIHALEVNDSCYMINVEFNLYGTAGLLTLGSLLQASDILSQWLHHKKPYQVGSDPDGSLYATLKQVVDDFAHKNDTDSAMRDLKLAEMLILVAGELLNAGSNSQCLVHVRRCVNLLSERMDEDVRIDELAKQVGVSSSYLQRIFRQVQGVTIVEYLNRLRIDRAKLLLVNTSDSVIDVAMAAGFNSRQHFCRVFASLEGCSPSQYRIQMQKLDAKQVFLFSQTCQNM